MVCIPLIPVRQMRDEESVRIVSLNQANCSSPSKLRVTSVREYRLSLAAQPWSSQMFVSWLDLHRRESRISKLKSRFGIFQRRHFFGLAVPDGASSPVTR